jgi:hypothetical protein
VCDPWKAADVALPFIPRGLAATSALVARGATIIPYSDGRVPAQLEGKFFVIGLTLRPGEEEVIPKLGSKFVHGMQEPGFS